MFVGPSLISTGITDIRLLDSDRRVGGNQTGAHCDGDNGFHGLKKIPRGMWRCGFLCEDGFNALTCKVLIGNARTVRGTGQGRNADCVGFPAPGSQSRLK